MWMRSLRRFLLGILILVAPVAIAQPAPSAAATGALDLGIEAAGRGELALAARHFHAAAEAGSAPAQFNLGRMHAAGLGVPQDGAEAARYFRMAAAQGFAPAQAQLARMLWRGTAVAPNPREAAGLARAAADQGEPEGFVVLGLLYFNGQGVPRNMIEAWYWLALTERHHPDPQQREWAQISRMRAANSLSLAQIEATRQRVDAWRMPAARAPSP